ncbi:MAG TPA: YbhN family protein [Cellvibrionaceae bacterium]
MNRLRTNYVFSRKRKKDSKLALVKRAITILFFFGVPILLFVLIKNVDWTDVVKSLHGLKPEKLALGLIICVISYAVVSTYDLLGRKYTKHSLPARQVLPIAFVCYAFNLNLGSWVGGIALRFRLYSRLGLNSRTITQILTFSLLSNWLGFTLLAGLVFAAGVIDLPKNWQIGTGGLKLIGVVLLLICGFYLWTCQFRQRRYWRGLGQKFELPSLGLATWQIALAALNWALMALLIFVLLPSKASYVAVLGILFISSAAGLILRIPGGVGVLETVFVTFLHHQFSKGTILAALIGYRVIYFLIPLAVAAVVYLIIESRVKKLRAENEQNQAEPAGLPSDDHHLLKTTSA